MFEEDLKGRPALATHFLGLCLNPVADIVDPQLPDLPDAKASTPPPPGTDPNYEPMDVDWKKHSKTWSPVKAELPYVFTAQKEKMANLEAKVSSVKKSVSFSQDTNTQSPPPGTSFRNKLSRSNRKNPRVMKRLQAMPQVNQILYQNEHVVHIQDEDLDKSVIIAHESGSGTDAKPFHPPNNKRKRKLLATKMDRYLASDDVQKDCDIRYSLNGHKMSDLLHTKKIEGNGDCLFNTFSYLLTGSQKYAATIRERICNFIQTSEKMANYIGKKGELYLAEMKMRDQGVWATDVEIVAAGQIMNCDIVVLTRSEKSDNTYQIKWQTFSFRTSQQRRKLGIPDDEVTDPSLYIENTTGLHYQAVIGFK
jgi:hypothetical protein